MHPFLLQGPWEDTCLVHALLAGKGDNSSDTPGGIQKGREEEDYLYLLLLVKPFMKSPRPVGPESSHPSSPW